MSRVSSGAKQGSSFGLGYGSEALCRPQIPKQPWERGRSMSHMFGHWGEDTFLHWKPRLTLPPVQVVEAAAPHVTPLAKKVPIKGNLRQWRHRHG
eukprot:2306415-Amphidinium_carterae.1